MERIIEPAEFDEQAHAAIGCGRESDIPEIADAADTVECDHTAGQCRRASGSAQIDRILGTTIASVTGVQGQAGGDLLQGPAGQSPGPKRIRQIVA